MTSCNSGMSISWRPINAWSIAILVGDVIPFMFKVAILIEAIRSKCGEEWAMVDDGFYTLSLLGCATLVLLLVRSCCIPAFFFSNFILLFRDRVCPGSSVLVSSSGGLVAPSARTCVLVVQPVCISDVCHNFLSGVFFSLRVCMLGSRSLSGWPIVKCRKFCFHGDHF